MAFQVPWGIAQEPEGTPWPGRGPGHLAPLTSRPLLARVVTTRANLLTPVTPFLPCPNHNGGAGQGYVPQWLVPVDPPSLQALRRPGFRSHRSTAVWLSSRSASCGSVVVARRCRPLTPDRPLCPGAPPPDSLRTRPPAGFHQGRLPSAWRHQSGQPDSADRAPTYLAMLESARLQPVRLP